MQIKQNDSKITTRLNKVFDYLKSNGMIKNKSDLAKALGTYNHVINDILKGKRAITLLQLKRLTETYLIDANYVLGFSDRIAINKSIVIEFNEKSLLAVAQIETLANQLKKLAQNYKPCN